MKVTGILKSLTDDPSGKRHWPDVFSMLRMSFSTKKNCRSDSLKTESVVLDLLKIEVNSMK